ncbi:MAG: Rab family GTPase [Thermoplasmatota archaeon]
MTEQFKRKVVLLGDGAVGKTSLVRRYVEQKFSDEYIATIGANFKKKTLEYKDEDIVLNLIIGDLLGQKGFQNTQKANMRGASGALLVSDLTREKTLKSIPDYWIPLLEEVLGEAPPIVFLANKADLIDMDDEDAKQFRNELLDLSEEHGAKFFFTSAKTGENVEQAFKDIGLLSLDKRPSSYYDDEIYRVEEGISTTDALDLIKAQLYLELGGEEFVNPILQRQLPVAGIEDINVTPKKEQLADLIDNLKDVEIDFLGENKAKKFHTKRKVILNKIE